MTVTKGRILALMSLHHAVNDGAILVISAILPALMAVLHFDIAAVGTLVSLSLVMTIIFQTLAGRVADRCPPGSLLVLGFILMAAALLFLPWTRSFTGLLLAVMLLRIGSSAYHPVGISWIARVFKEEGVDRALGIQSSSGNAGVILVMFTSGWLAEWSGWKSPVYLWAGLCLLVIVVDLFVLGLRFRCAAAPDPPAPVPGLPPRAGRKHPLQGLLWVVFPSVIAGGMFTVVVNFGPIYLTSLPGTSLGLAGMVIGLAWLGAGSLVAVYYGKLRERLSRRAILMGVVSFSSLSLLLFGAFPYLWTAAGFLMLNGLTLFMAYPAIQSYISELADPAAQGRAFGYFFSLQLVGATVISYICGFLGKVFHAGAPFLFTGALGLLCAAWLVRYIPAAAPAES